MTNIHHSDQEIQEIANTIRESEDGESKGVFKVFRCHGDLFRSNAQDSFDDICDFCTECVEVARFTYTPGHDPLRHGADDIPF